MRAGSWPRRTSEALLLILFALLVLAPLAALVFEAIQPVRSGQSLLSVSSLLGRDTFGNLKATLQLATWTAGVALMAGAFLAGLLDAVPPRGLRWVEPLLLGSFLIPPYLTAVAWTLIAGPVGLWNQLFGHGGAWLAKALYSLPGMAIVMALHLTPLVYVMASAALRGVDHSLREAAQVHGAPPWHARWMGYRPGVIPALLAATLLVFLASAEEFGVPKVLGNLAGVQVLSVAVEQAMDVWPTNLPRASAIGLLLGAISLVIWLLAFPLTRANAGTAQRRPARTHRWSGVPPLLFALIATGLPLAAIAITALQKAVTNGLASGNWTGSHFARVLRLGDGGLSALMASTGLAVFTSIVGMAFAVIGLLALQRAPRRLGRALEAAGYAPQAVPGVVMATGLILFWNAPGNPLPIYGHISIIAIAYLALTLPYALRYAASGLQQIPESMTQAASVHGARMPRILARITLPLAWPHIVAGAAVLFAFSMRELASSILLQPPGVQVISTYIYAQFDQGNVNDGMALAVVGFALTLAVLVIARVSGSVLQRLSG
ncbi:ABC transporter permease [Thiomonas intermedia]|uniref:ABC transporter permease n=1 Tax=Thiomonas intermedia TaxID=926 RepID=UPI0009A473DE|nr:iron ABC transporter permease [Thiomonas intermedia]